METESIFNTYGLSEPVAKALAAMNFNQPTPIQELVLPFLMKKDSDLIALASTGSGKTGAFGIPLVEKIASSEKTTQALILCPTRELAIQVSEQIQKLSMYKGLTIATIYGGASYLPQERALKKGAHIIVATPGRLIDFIDQGKAKLDEVKVLVLDEADEMISMGFSDDLEKILESMPQKTQRWLYSATMSREIRKIADRYLTTPEMFAINKSQGVSDTIEQIYFTVKQSNKVEALIRIIETEPTFYGIIFCQTKNEVADLNDHLHRRGYAVEAIHGDRTQKEREYVLKKFKERTTKVLVATDVAARGLDIKDLTHVVNFSLPRDIESYIHRIGRTGRAGQKGIALSLVSPDEIRRLARIQQVTGKTFLRGIIPSNKDAALIKIEHMLTKSLEFTADDKRVQIASDLVAALMVKNNWDLRGITAEELVGRMVTLFMPKILIEREMDLDYFPPGKIPRELMTKDQLKEAQKNDRDFGRSDRPQRSDRSQRSDRGGERSERGPRSDRYDRGSNSDRGFRSDRPARGGGGFEGRRRDFDRGGERQDRDDRFGGNSERGSTARFQQDESAPRRPRGERSDRGERAGSERREEKPSFFGTRRSDSTRKKTNELSFRERRMSRQQND